MRNDKSIPPRLQCLLLLVAIIVSCAGSVSAQPFLKLVDVLPPYKLSATLLDNGHFSISTMYTDSAKTLVYQEDGSGGRPVNYTSHIHFKVDNVVFQLPYELNPATRDLPPLNPLTITQLYRDTVAGIARINARMYGVMPDGDTMRFLFTMHPFKRPSGGFIRLQAEVHNTSRRPRSVGVLMLVDTKIGDNDRAPLVTAFGYRTNETEFYRSLAPGMPEFWLALEGTPIDPQLVARGNLRASELIEPDYFLGGNWKDNTAVPGAFGLAIAQWKERTAFNVPYTDSAVLLLWDEQTMGVGEKRLRAATEIGIVDSLEVAFGGGGSIGLAGGGIGGGASGGGCLAFDTLRQRDCADPAYHPYNPDSLQALYLVTNTGTNDLSNPRVVVGTSTPGLTVASNVGAVVPNLLTATSTGVATLTFHAEPRLRARSYSIPIAVVAGAGDTLLKDELCVFVPGLEGSIDADDASIEPLCPGMSDTVDVIVNLNGPRCLDLTPSATLIGAPADVARFSIVPPLPARIPTMGRATYRVAYTAGPAGVANRVKLVVRASEAGLNDADVLETVEHSDTADIDASGRDAEFQFANTRDTLDFGAVCIGDTSHRQWLVTNIGGCVLSIRSDYVFLNDALTQFNVDNPAAFPMSVQRGADEQVPLQFAPKAAGIAIARVVIRSDALPFADTLILKGRGDIPALSISGPPIAPDTVCPGERYEAAIPVNNPTACDVTITSVTSSDAQFVVDLPQGVVLPPFSSRRLLVSGSFPNASTYISRVTISSNGGPDTAIDLRIVVASRELVAGPALSFGDVRVGVTSGTQRITVVASGTAETVVQRLRIAGANPSEYSFVFPNGETLPLRMQPGDRLEVDVTFAPSDLESRRALLVVEPAVRGACNVPDPVALTGRGVMPVIDAPRRIVQLGSICAGIRYDTTIVVRNLGNAPLTISGVESIGAPVRATVVTTGLPAILEPDSARMVTISVQPEALGAFDILLRFASDGTWFTAPDTTVRVSGTGVLCANVWIDTIHANVGDRIDIPVRIDASPVTSDRVATLLNDLGSQPITISIAHDGKVMRFVAVAPTGGMLTAVSGVQVLPTGAGVRVDAPAATGLSSSPMLVTLAAEVLLGDKDRTVLALMIEKLAGGFTKLNVNNGLLIPNYCALDQRMVNVGGLLLSATSSPMTTSGAFVIYLPESGHATLTMHDGLGRVVATIFDEDAPKGARTIAVPSDAITSGAYTVVLRANGEHVMQRVVVVR